MEQREIFRQWVLESRKIVFFGGAGVSTESGIPDFRGVDGLYKQHYADPPETILSAGFFRQNPGEFYRFYREKMLVTGAQPNAAHWKLAEWEKKGRLSAIVTQNIDGLHQKAGSKRVVELHGSIYRNYCVRCNRPYGVEAVEKSQGVPLCECGGIIKPDVVLYGENLDGACLEDAVRFIAGADMLIVGGTSLTVYPAAGLIDTYSGNRLALINRSATPRDRRANLILRESIGELFAWL